VTAALSVSPADQAAEAMLQGVEDSTGVPTTLPIDPIRIARQLGIQVYVANLTPGTSAMLQKEPGRAAVIYLSVNEGLNRQRFSCAHELGHYYAHQGQDDGDYGYIDNRDQMAQRGTDPAERWANSFAAALLMPAAAVRKTAPPYDPVNLSLQFAVSPEAMRYRLVNLRLR
jgi:Zn-dependent peptidase ImmA (M78 family)